MIKLTRLDGNMIIINEDFIETIEATPDSTINLHNGTTYVVVEKLDKILKLIEKWKIKTNKSGR